MRQTKIYSKNTAFKGWQLFTWNLSMLPVALLGDTSSKLVEVTQVSSVGVCSDKQVTWVKDSIEKKEEKSKTAEAGSTFLNNYFSQLTLFSVNIPVWTVVESPDVIRESWMFGFSPTLSIFFFFVSGNGTSVVRSTCGCYLKYSLEKSQKAIKWGWTKTEIKMLKKCSTTCHWVVFPWLKKKNHKLYLP